MTPPKRWYLQLAGDKETSDVQDDSTAPNNLVLFNSEGPMKKRNGAEPLGNVQEVCHPDSTKYTDDYVMFHCENGRIALSTKAYMQSKSVISERCTSIDEFMTLVNDFISGRLQTSGSLTQLSSVQQLTPTRKQQSTIRQQSSTQPASQSPLNSSQHQPSTQSTTQHKSLTQSASANPSTPSCLLSSNPSTNSSPIQQQLLIQSSPSPSQASDQSVQPTMTPPQEPSGITNKRNRILDSNQSLSKRLKCINNDMDEEIERHRKGLFEVPVSQLMIPPKDSRLLRATDNMFVEKLKEKMMLDPSAPGATPMAILCKDVTSIDQFNDKFVNVYKYEVLGGLHTLTAKTELTEEFPDNPFFQQALAEVYTGLSDEQALRLAQRHNSNSHFVHKVTHRELLEVCRARLYKLAHKETDSETPGVTVEWKESCKRAIIPKDTSATQRDAILYQSSLPKPVWDIAVEIMEMCENGKLKDQKARCGVKAAKPEFKQQYLAPIRCLSLADQCDLLLKCRDKEISLVEMKKQAEMLKKLEMLKKAFVKLTNSRNWEDAKDRFQPFASESKLKKFATLETTKEVPQSFVNFCRRAKTSRETGLSSIQDQITKHGELVAVTFQSNLSTISGQVIKAVYPDFSGADMILMSVPEGSSVEEIESLGYTAKEINSSSGLYTYTTIATCSPTSLHNVTTAWYQVFGNIDTLFTISEDFHKPGESKKLDSCVMAVVLGYQSIDGLTKGSQFIFEEGESTSNYIKGSKEDISIYLLKHFCSPGGTVLDISNDSEGTMSMVALQEGNNVIGTAEGQDVCAAIFERLQEKYATGN